MQTMKNLFRKLGFGLGTMKISLGRPKFFLGERLLGQLEFESKPPRPKACRSS